MAGNSRNDQIGVTFTAQEREIIDKIANDLGRSLASVVRDCTISGLPAIIRQHEELMEARQKMNLEGKKDK